MRKIMVKPVQTERFAHYRDYFVLPLGETLYL
jgi:hypothetical protein